MDKPFTGDLDQMIKRRAIRVAVTFNRTHYFIDQGQERGLTYESLKLFENDLNTDLKTGNLKVHVVIVPMSREQLYPALSSGRVDMVAAMVTVTPERLANLRVLVVDDNETNRRILVEWLTSWRMQPTPASDATQTLSALASAHAAGAPFSLVLLDARMPDIDGVTLAGEIRRRWEAGAPRLILLSSEDSAELSALARDSGVLAYLLKPVQQSELLEAIWAVMNLEHTVPASAGPAGGQPERSWPLRVLVAEDNELNVTLLKELLGSRGHLAQFARDGRAALQLALQGEFDLMLLDLHMPELDGFEVVQAIRDHERGTNQHLRIIALTARSSG